MDEWLPLLGDLVRLDIPDNRLTRGLDPQLRQELRFDLLERLLLHAATQSPLLVVFEDLHWADQSHLNSGDVSCRRYATIRSCCLERTVQRLRCWTMIRRRCSKCENFQRMTATGW